MKNKNLKYIGVIGIELNGVVEGKTLFPVENSDIIKMIQSGLSVSPLAIELNENIYRVLVIMPTQQQNEAVFMMLCEQVHISIALDAEKLDKARVTDEEMENLDI